MRVNLCHVNNERIDCFSIYLDSELDTYRFSEG
jgi:hypothetical protein